MKHVHVLRYLLTYTLAFTPTIVYASITDKLPLRFSGFIQHDTFWDSRQVITDREGLGLYYPAQRIESVDGTDINAQGEFNMLPIYTRLAVESDGPQVYSAKTRGYIEVDFLGRVTIPSVIRMRHAYLDLIWQHISLRAGQYWHPLTLPEALPDVVDINTGWPMNPFLRSPQILFRYAKHHHEIKLAAITQLDGTSPGPDGNSSTYMRNAIIPNLYAEIKGLWKHQFAGIGFDYKRLRPRLSSTVDDTLYKVNETVNSLSGIIFAALQYPDWHLYTKWTYGENLDELNMINGYAVTATNPVTGAQCYTPIRALSWWIDASIKCNEYVEPGVYVGYTKNIGSHTPLWRDSNGQVVVYARTPNLDHVATICPRLYWRVNKFKLGIEVVYSQASYGTINNNGTIDNPIGVGDFRFHMALYYFF
jgi:hypothetical protein